MADALEIARSATKEAAGYVQRLAGDEALLAQVAAAGEMITTALASGHKVITCGNGGSMADAMHLAEELSGRFRSDRRALPALALSDPSYLTCAGNDFGFDSVFARGVEALGAQGDVLVAFSTSGTSGNVLAAVDRAREIGVCVLGLTGAPDSPLARRSTLALCTPAGKWADRVQELHGIVLHVLIEIVEAGLGLALT